MISIVQLACGGQSSENCTYFVSDGKEIGQCRIKICPCSDNICQLRLDFSTFVLNGPATGICFFFIPYLSKTVGVAKFFLMTFFKF